MEISEVARRNILDYVRIREISWSGRLSEVDFLNRLYRLKEMPSNDARCKTAESDISLHRCNFNDWGEYWIFDDPRFDLVEGSDEAFLKFLKLMLDPVVREESDDVKAIACELNTRLRADGWEYFLEGEISGRPLFNYRKCSIGIEAATKRLSSLSEDLNAIYVDRQISRMQHALNEEDVELAIGTSKEFVETICKTIMGKLDPTFDHKEVDFPQLVRTTIDKLEMLPKHLVSEPNLAQSIRALLGNLTQVSSRIAEIRNAFGSGHGKDAHRAQLEMKHAKLVVGVATTLGVFLFDCYQAG